MPHFLESFVPHIPGSTFSGDKLELRPVTDYLRLGTDSIVWTHSGVDREFDLRNVNCLKTLAARLRAAGIENTLDAK